MTALHQIEVVGHGGAAAFYQGNTEPSIVKALAIGVDRVEVDVRISADRELVLMHDNEIEIDDQQRLASETNWSDLKKAFPDLIRLPDAFEIIDGDVPIMIDIKGRGYEREVIDLVDHMNPRVESTASSTHARSLKLIHQELPAMRLGLSRGHSMTRYPFIRYRNYAGAAVSGLQSMPIVSLARWCGATELMLQYHLCNAVIAASAKTLGFRLYPWTVDNPRSIRSLVELDVAGIISNRPDLVREALEQSHTSNRAH